EVERRAGDGYDPQLAPFEPLNTLDRLVFEQALICSGHTEQAGNPLLSDGMGQRSGVGLGHNIQRGAMHQRGDQQDRIADDVGHRQHAVDAVARAALAKNSRSPCGKEQVAVAQHDALRSTGRARSVEKARDLGRAILLDGLRLRIRIEWPNTDSTEWSHSVYFGADAAGMIGGFLRKRRVEQYASCAAV